MRLVCVAGAMTLAVVTCAGCAQSGYDPSKLERQLARAGLSQKQAQCITDGLQSTFDINQLGSHSEPTSRELATTRAIIVGCGVKLPPA